jgi:hypothetical protein
MSKHFKGCSPCGIDRMSAKTLKQHNAKKHGKDDLKDNPFASPDFFKMLRDHIFTRCASSNPITGKEEIPCKCDPINCRLTLVVPIEDFARKFHGIYQDLARSIVNEVVDAENRAELGVKYLGEPSNPFNPPSDDV